MFCVFHIILHNFNNRYLFMLNILKYVNGITMDWKKITDMWLF